MRHAGEAADEKAGADHQHHGERGLDDHQDAAGAVAAGGAGAGPRAVAQRFGEVRPGHLEGRREPRQQARQQGHSQGEQQDARIERQVTGDRHVVRNPEGERPQPPEGQEEPGRAAGGREQRALGEELAHHPPPAGAERRADGDLLLPRRRLGEQEAGHVHTGDQQHDPDGGEEDQQSGPDVPHQLAAQRRHAVVPAGVGIGVGFFHSPGDLGHLGLRLGDADAGLQQTDREIAAVPPVLPSLGRKGQRHPDVRLGGEPEAVRHLAAARKGETGGHHPHHRQRRAVDVEDAAEHVAVAAETALPEVVREQDGGPLALVVVLRQQDAAEQGRRAERLEELAGDPHRRDLLGIAVPREAQPVGVDDRHLRERLRRLPVVEGRRRDRQLVGEADLPGQLRVRGPDHRQPLGIAERQRRQQHRIDDAEDRRVGADPQRQREDGDDRERRPLEQRPAGEAKVLQQGLHAGPPLSSP